MTDTGAGTPLTADEEADLRVALSNSNFKDSPATVTIRRLLATLDRERAVAAAMYQRERAVSRSLVRPATDPAGLDVARLAEAMRNTTAHLSSDWTSPANAASIAAEYARLAIADGPGPEERLREAFVTALVTAWGQAHAVSGGETSNATAIVSNIEERFKAFVPDWRQASIEAARRAALPIEETGR